MKAKLEPNVFNLRPSIGSYTSPPSLGTLGTLSSRSNIRIDAPTACKIIRFYHMALRLGFIKHHLYKPICYYWLTY